MDFEWDDAKAASNLRKHGIAFEDAAHVFLDDGRVDIVDVREDYGEIRWLTMGRAGLVLLVVACTLRGADGDIIRIISARKANASERAYYRENEA
ncbi:BrnT family toxin [Rhodanobacter ginsengiterrae]|uniref:BrnT family toxin n=1 Tax=Rhodanobacter ginsengiterrae TaxID=2008451 RepID=UPI003CF50E40